MTEIEDLAKVLKEWREKDIKTVTNTLSRLQAFSNFQDLDLDKLLQAVTLFHKEISKEEDDADPAWYQSCIKLKNKFKKMIDTQQKERQSEPVMEKKSSKNIEYPPSLLLGRCSSDQQILKSLYKNFITCFDEAANKE